MVSIFNFIYPYSNPTCKFFPLKNLKIVASYLLHFLMIEFSFHITKAEHGITVRRLFKNIQVNQDFLFVDKQIGNKHTPKVSNVSNMQCSMCDF